MRVLVVSNMYPNQNNPSYGIFVKRFVDQLKLLNLSYDLSIMYKKDKKISKIIGYAKFYFITITKILLNKYDVIYIHYASHSGLPILIANKFKKLNVYTNVHGSDVVPENKKQEKFQKYTKNLLEISDKVIVPSEYFKHYIIKKYKIEDKVFIYPSCGIDGKLFYPYNNSKKEIIKKELGLSRDNIYIGFVGRISYGKGWNTFLKSISVVRNSYPNLRFIIVGSGPEEKELDEAIVQDNLSEVIIRFKLLPQEKLADIYNILSVLIFPTEREGESLGLVAIEAMACGTPIIASDFSAPKYYIDNGYNGFKFNKGNHKELAKRISDYLNLNQYEKSKMKSSALEVSVKFDEKNIISMLQTIFK